MIYLDFAFLGSESRDAAEAAHCAQEQGKFWEYHDLLFEHQTGENIGDFKRENLERFAQQLSLNMDSFRQCLDTHKYADFVRAEMSQGRKLHVQSTPTLVINGELYPGFMAFNTEREENDLTIAPGATITNSLALSPGSDVCLSGRLDDKRRLSSATVSQPPGDNTQACGTVKKYTPAGPSTGGQLVIEEEVEGLKQIIDSELKKTP